MSYSVGVIAGDGVGPEVLAESRKALGALELALELEELPWGSAHWHEHGRMMPADAVERLRGFDAVLLGAVGDPRVPDDVTLWGLLLELRQGLDLWANVRPARGLFAPLLESQEPAQEFGAVEAGEVSLDDVDHAPKLGLRVRGPRPRKP